MKVEIQGDTDRAMKAVEAIQKIDAPAEADQIDAGRALLRIRAKHRELRGAVTDRE